MCLWPRGAIAVRAVAGAGAPDRTNPGERATATEARQGAGVGRGSGEAPTASEGAADAARPIASGRSGRAERSTGRRRSEVG